MLCASPAYLARQPAPQGPEDFERHAWLVFQHPSLNQNFGGWERRRPPAYRPAAPATGQRQLRLPARPLLLAGLGLQFCPQWSVAPLPVKERLVAPAGDTT
ncbi:hypothetical protein ACPA9J_18755 [Pseudomonas aeruginosa]